MPERHKKNPLYLNAWPEKRLSEKTVPFQTSGHGSRVAFLSEHSKVHPLLCLFYVFGSCSHSLSLCAKWRQRQRFARAPPGLLLSVRYHSSRSHFLPEWGFLCSFISFRSLSLFFSRPQLDLKHSVYSTIKGPWCIKSKDPASMESGVRYHPCCSLHGL